MNLYLHRGLQILIGEQPICSRFGILEIDELQCRDIDVLVLIYRARIFLLDGDWNLFLGLSRKINVLIALSRKVNIYLQNIH